MPRKPHYAEGPYWGDVVSQNLSEAKTGSIQFVLSVKVLGDNLDGELEEFERREQYQRTIYLPLTEKTLDPKNGWVLEVLGILGFDRDSLNDLNPGAKSHQSFVGMRVPLWCSHQDDNEGGTREKWSISRQATREVVIADPKKIKKLDSLFGKAKRSSGAPSTKPKPNKATDRKLEDGTEITDDDLPESMRGQPDEEFDPDRPF